MKARPVEITQAPQVNAPKNPETGQRSTPNGGQGAIASKSTAAIPTTGMIQSFAWKPDRGIEAISLDPANPSRP